MHSTAAGRSDCLLEALPFGHHNLHALHQFHQITDGMLCLYGCSASRIIHTVALITSCIACFAAAVGVLLIGVWHASSSGSAASTVQLADVCCQAFFRSVFSATALGSLQQRSSQLPTWACHHTGWHMESEVHSSGLPAGQICTSPIIRDVGGMRPV